MNSGNQWAEASPWGFPEGSSPQVGPSRTAGLYQFRSSSILPPPTPSVPSPYFSSSFQAFAHDVHQGHPHHGRDGFGSQSAAHLLPQFGDGKVAVPTLQHSQPAPLLAASTSPRCQHNCVLKSAKNPQAPHGRTIGSGLGAAQASHPRAVHGAEIVATPDNQDDAGPAQIFRHVSRPTLRCRHFWRSKQGTRCKRRNSGSGSGQRTCPRTERPG